MELKLVGYCTEDGERFPVFRDGNWDYWTYDPSEGIPVGTLCRCVFKGGFWGHPSRDDL